MIATRLRELLDAYLRLWAGGGEPPTNAAADVTPHWYDGPYWC